MQVLVPGMNRWSEKGWIFTLGEGVSGGLFMWGMIDLLGHCFERCSQEREQRAEWMLFGGLIGTAVFRIWEIVDAFTGPSEHNQRLRTLQMRLGMPVPMYTRITPYVTPSRDGGGAVGGLSLRF